MIKSADTRKKAREIAKSTGGKVVDMRKNVYPKTVIGMKGGKAVKRRWAVKT